MQVQAAPVIDGKRANGRGLEELSRCWIRPKVRHQDDTSANKAISHLMQRLGEKRCLGLEVVLHPLDADVGLSRNRPVARGAKPIAGNDPTECVGEFAASLFVIDSLGHSDPCSFQLLRIRSYPYGYSLHCFYRRHGAVLDSSTCGSCPRFNRDAVHAIWVFMALSAVYVVMLAMGDSASADSLLTLDGYKELQASDAAVLAGWIH